ncbi:MAG: response regulator [Ignavibacteria bacterium]
MNTEKFKILIAEDEKIIALDLKMILEKAGYSVISILDNLNDITAKISEIKPNLVLLDINLDEKYEGLRVAGYLNKLDIPLIFISGSTDQKTIRRAKSIKPCGYINKPFDELRILSAVEKCLKAN